MKQMVVVEQYRKLLARVGLCGIDEVKVFRGEVVKNQRGRREILRIEAVDDQGRGVVLYLKRILRAYVKDGVWSVLRRGRVWSMARQEWENILAINKAGIQTVEAVAYGEECGALWEKFSFIITRSAPGEQTVEQLLIECHDPKRRRRVIQAMGRHARKMHDAGLATPDLFARHFFVDDEGDQVRFWLIDMARLDQRGWVSPGLRARDLAALHVGLPMRVAGKVERVRFLKAYYGGRIDRGFMRLLGRRAGRLMKREKFRDFDAPRAI